MKKQKYKKIDEVDESFVKIGDIVSDIIGSTQVAKIWSECKSCGKKRWVRMRYRKPAYDHCMPCSRKNKARSGDKNSSWTGGRQLRPDGYIDLYITPDNKFYGMAKGKRKKYVYEHRLVMAQKIGRPLEKWEIVHHIDGNKSNNDISNLSLFPEINKNIGITKMEDEINIRRKRIIMLKKVIRDNANAERE